MKEYDELILEARALMKRLEVSAMDVEKVSLEGGGWKFGIRKGQVEAVHRDQEEVGSPKRSGESNFSQAIETRC
ncbi:hypothetical protein HYQ44_018936 [Verticillium longisporum]|nr:hypothetical protein HYQ44_018936 [Verticillium longisporum]